MQLLNTYIHNVLKQKSAEFERYTRELYKVLPTMFTGQCYICNVQEHSITISVESSLLANRLHYYRTELTKNFSRYFNRQITYVSLKINPTSAIPQTKAVSTLHLSPDSAKKLVSLAENIDDSYLKESLLKLSKKIHS